MGAAFAPPPLLWTAAPAGQAGGEPDRSPPFTAAEYDLAAVVTSTLGTNPKFVLAVLVARVASGICRSGTLA